MSRPDPKYQLLIQARAKLIIADLINFPPEENTCEQPSTPDEAPTNTKPPRESVVR